VSLTNTFELRRWRVKRDEGKKGETLGGTRKERGGIKLTMTQDCRNGGGGNPPKGGRWRGRENLLVSAKSDARACGELKNFSLRTGGSLGKQAASRMGDHVKSEKKASCTYNESSSKSRDSRG